MPVGSGAMHTLTPLGSASQTGQVGFGAGLVDKDQPRRVQRRLLPPPVAARSGNIGPILLTGTECLFLYVSPIFSNT